MGKIKDTVKSQLEHQAALRAQAEKDRQAADLTKAANTAATTRWGNEVAQPAILEAQKDIEEAAKEKGVPVRTILKGTGSGFELTVGSAGKVTIQWIPAVATVSVTGSFGGAVTPQIYIDHKPVSEVTKENLEDALTAFATYTFRPRTRYD